MFKNLLYWTFFPCIIQYPALGVRLYRLVVLNSYATHKTSHFLLVMYRKHSNWNKNYVVAYICSTYYVCSFIYKERSFYYSFFINCDIPWCAKVHKLLFFPSWRQTDILLDNVCKQNLCLFSYVSIVM